MKQPALTMAKWQGLLLMTLVVLVAGSLAAPEMREKREAKAEPDPQYYVDPNPGYPYQGNAPGGYPGEGYSYEPTDYP